MLSIEFGSQNRGDSNYSSDKDLLLIGNCSKKLLEEKNIKKSLGHSVTCFPIDKARILVQNGSLFFKHIIEEGKIINGSHDSAQELFKLWRAPKNYDNDIDGNIELLELLSHIPKTQEGLVVAADMVTISIRNILIRRYASNGKYIFSWNGMIAQGSSVNIFDTNDQIILAHGRHLKNFYRQGLDVKVSVQFVERLIQILNKIIIKKISIRFDEKQNISKLPESLKEGSYKQLRSIELLCACYGFNKAPQSLLEEIKDPNNFSNKNWEVNRMCY
jgi:hypothetical protein